MNIQNNLIEMLGFIIQWLKSIEYTNGWVYAWVHQSVIKVVRIKNRSDVQIILNSISHQVFLLLNM